MRFTTTSIMFIVAGFIFLAFWGFSSLLIDEVGNALDDVDDNLPTDYTEIRNLLPTAFGIIAAIFFVCGIILIFVLDSISDEPEMYYRRR